MINTIAIKRYDQSESSTIITTFIIKTYIINSLRAKLLKAYLRDFEADKSCKEDGNPSLVSINMNY